MGVNIPPLVTSNPIDLTYFTKDDNQLTLISFVLMVYTSSPFPANISNSVFITNSYSTDLDDATSASPSGAYSSGFDMKCMLGFDRLSYMTTMYLQYDITNILPTKTWNISAAYILTIFCMV